MPDRAGEAIMISRFRPLIQLAGLLRKESVAIGRQPRLLLVLVAGPFLVLLLFAVGYNSEQVVLRTAFVGPPDSIYERSIDEFADELTAYVDSAGFTTDVVDAQDRLEDNDVDLVVIFPPDAAEDVLGGERAVITILHDKLDPIQQTAVEVAAQVAVQELNATILENIATQAQDTLVPYEEGLRQSASLLDGLTTAISAGDDEEIAAARAGLSVVATQMSTVVAATDQISTELRGDLASEDRERITELRSALGQFERRVEALADSGEEIDEDRVDALRDALDEVEAHSVDVTTIDPAMIVRPFTSDARSLVRERIRVIDFFAPAAIALLLQHMVLTFAAMGLVTDRTLGLFEVFRVGPIGAGRILSGKYLAYLMLGGAVAVALFSAVSLGLDVPQRGELIWIIAGVIGLLSASIGLGMVLSLVARSDTQAVQFAMLALLSGLFFGGFFLDLEAFRYPVKAISWSLPVTYGIRLLRDTMLRGVDPSWTDLVGLVGTTLVFGLAAWALLYRRLRVE
jgi:ABC-2 type transport system permease protein